MDPFTQRMLEKAEQRSRALGISSAAVSKFPVSNMEASSENFNTLSGACATTMAMASQQQEKQKKPMQAVEASEGICASKHNKLQVIEKNNKDITNTSQKVLRQFSAVDKENMDLGIEINIVTDKDVEVQVEQEVSDDECKDKQDRKSGQVLVQPTAKIRDTSRNRLQRLGALYSNTDDLSSPIHRTEGKFHADGNEDNIDSQHQQQRKPNQRLGKLAALANTINQWEDDTSHHSISTTAPNAPNPAAAPPKPDLPSRGRNGYESKAVFQSSLQTENFVTSTNEKDKVKQLKWDSKVMDSLEAQGFQRRESSTVKISYEFSESKDDKPETPVRVTDKSKEGIVEEKRIVGKLANNIFTAAEKKILQSDKKLPNVKSGLVSGRTAIFESQSQNSQQQKTQKDPTELSLKERMKLFEKNKGEALVPRAAFGMAPAISKIIQDTNQKKEDNLKVKPNSNLKQEVNSNNPVPVVKTFVDCKVRDKVNALVNATTANTIKEDIKKQREEDLQVLANRFNKQKDFLTQQPTISNKRMPTPPPPPPPISSNMTNITSKRRSPGAVNDEDNKRARKSIQGTKQRLYPVLPYFETNQEFSESDNENNCCTTASVSALSTSDEMKLEAQPLRGNNNDHNHNGTDDDHEDSYMESEAEDSSVGICNGSLGREIMQVVEKNDKEVHNKVKEVHYADKDHYIEDNTFETSINSSEASMGVDDYLDEALEENEDEEADEDDNSRLSKNSKGTTASNSFSFRKASSEYETHDSVPTSVASSNSVTFMQPVKSELSVNKENDNIVTLVHTVSFYRKQQSANSANSTPIRKICREQQVLRSAIEKLDAKSATSAASLHYEPDTEEFADEDTQSDSEVDDANLVQEKIKKLLEEVCKQQQVIAQTSQALNLCAATIEFSGSTESVEGERHLLVATHRRQACLDEVQRLRVEKTLRPLGAPKEKGRLTVKEITIPLRQDYIRKLSLDTISGHHLVCLIKYNEHVLATKTVPTLPGLLAVKFPDVLQLNNVYADFKVTLEIYGMTAQREVLPHEVKYHINFNKKSGIKTPKKKASDNRLVMPPVQSPAGPQAVRTPALVQYGFAIFSLREIQRTSWTLTQVLGVSPLEGIVHMKVNCELSVSVEYKGFLTMFEDISGFGAWHRRWCHLNGTMLNYWKYPDDEKKKTPMGSIDLYTCSSQKVNIAPRDICARLNTMLLECQRPAKDTDHESLIIVPNGRTTTVRYLLSADTKEEREEWCAYFNKTLTLLRAWGPPQ
ncbi:anillin, actin binding protein isoform 2-T3 [Cochliomyia hominivorax]